MPIINQVVKGGGTTPTGTIQITTNGTHDVTNYASADVQVPTTAPASYRAFQKDANGNLVNSTSTPWVPLPAGTKTVGTYMFNEAYKGTPANILNGAIDLSSLTSLPESAMRACFYGCTGITSVDLSSLVTMSGSYTCYQMFYGCTGLTSVDLSALVTAGSTQAMKEMFCGCTGLTSVDLSSLTNFVNYAYAVMDGCFKNCTNLISVNLSSLVNVTSSMGSCFYGCTSLTSVDISSLTTMSQTQAFASVFYGCTSLTTFVFPSLSNLTGTNSLQWAFQNCTNLTSVYFPALNSSSFGSYTNHFNDMLKGVTGCTVHFPMAIQSTIGSWSDVTNGFGGTNTTVLFDIVTSLTGADSNTYTRKQKESTSTATAWTYNDTLYYTSGTTEPTVGTTIYSDSACTIAVTTINSIA